MGIVEIFLIALGLAMDAFAVSVCKGLSMKKLDWKKAIIIGLYFGIFQALMPVIGYFLGSAFENVVTKIDHWIAFILLAIIGINMIRESLKKECDCENINDNVDFKTMIVLAIATSIDALAVGISFAFLNVNIWTAVAIIGIVTFILSLVGVKIGNKFGDKYERKAEFIGRTNFNFNGCKNFSRTFNWIILVHKIMIKLKTKKY